jgi:predicted DsbA family dithiol-disulfide isomerase
MTITVAHDFICPWCWIALFQVKRMTQEFGVEVDWVGYELFPEGMEWSVSAGSAPDNRPNRPVTPSRLQLAYAAEGMEPPTAERPKQMRIHNAMEAIEYAKTEGVANELVEKLYRAYWEEGREINSPQILQELAEGIVKDVPEMLRAVEEKRFNDKIVPFDDEAYAAGVYNVPTFFISGERYAEQPYAVLRKALSQ